MTDSEILNLFIPFVDFLGQVLGENTEVVLHDVSCPEHSVVAIRHGFHSGRTVGSSLTDFAFRVKNNKEYENHDYLINYRAKAKGNDFIASTYYIKNEGRLIGMLCLNTNTTASRDFIQSAARFFETLPMGGCSFLADNTPDGHGYSEENLDIPIVSLAESIIAKTIADSNISPERMTRAEKMQIVWELADQGIPRMKGAVSEIAKQLKLSESTVYRYISQKSDND